MSRLMNEMVMKVATMTITVASRLAKLKLLFAS